MCERWKDDRKEGEEAINTDMQVAEWRHDNNTLYYYIIFLVNFKKGTDP